MNQMFLKLNPVGFFPDILRVFRYFSLSLTLNGYPVTAHDVIACVSTSSHISAKLFRRVI